MCTLLQRSLSSEGHEKINECQHDLLVVRGEAGECEEMVSRYILIRDWVLILVVQLCLVRCSADYFWDGTEWKWQDSPQEPSRGQEGSGNWAGANTWTNDDEEEADTEGSADDLVNESDFDIPVEEDSQVDKDFINVDDEIDLDIGFDETTKISTSSTTVNVVAPTDPTVLDDPHKQFNQDTNFFAQPGILTGKYRGGSKARLAGHVISAVIGGTVVGLLCTILLVMFIVYRMRKADEGSYSLNEPKRSPNVHSYLKAPSREFFA